MQTMGRTAEFNVGTQPPSPIGIQRTSALMPYMKSLNGKAQSEAPRQTPMGQLPSPNDGYSKNTYDALFTGVPTQVGY